MWVEQDLIGIQIAINEKNENNFLKSVIICISKSQEEIDKESEKIDMTIIRFLFQDTRALGLYSLTLASLRSISSSGRLSRLNLELLAR